ncbi:MAG: hypothetical protein ACKPJO_10990, partial [Dolichospermum sp.]
KLSLSNPGGTDKSPQKLSLKVEVDDSPLYSLNKHLDLKYKHFKEVNQYFKNNSLTPTVDDRELTNLNKELAQLTGKSAGDRTRVSVDVEVNKEKANLIINNNNNSKEIVEQLKLVEKAVIDSAELSLGRSLGIGITEEFGKVISRNLMSGFKKNLGLDIAGATRSFTRVVSKPLSKVNPESIQKFEDDIVSALEESLIFKNNKKAEAALRKAFAPIGEGIQSAIEESIMTHLIPAVAQPLRIRKRVLLAQSMLDAQKMSSKVKVDDNEQIRSSKSISIIVGGIDFDNKSPQKNSFKATLENILPESYSVAGSLPYSNNTDNLGQIAKLRMGVVKALQKNGTIPKDVKFLDRQLSDPIPFDRLLDNVEKGSNPDAVKLASQAMAYRRKYPDKPINLAGNSGGSYVVEEAIGILERAGYENIKGVGISAPFSGLTPVASSKNFKSIVGDVDPLYLATFGGKYVKDTNSLAYTKQMEMFPFRFPQVLKPSDMNMVVPGGGFGHKDLPYLSFPEVQANLKSHLGNNIGDISPEFTGELGSKNLDYLRTQNAAQRTKVVRTFKTIFNDGSTVRQTKDPRLSKEWKEVLFDPEVFSDSRRDIKKKGKNTTGNTKQIAEEYLEFLEDLKKGLDIFIEAGSVSRQNLLVTLEKAVEIHPELRDLQVRVIDTLGEQARLTNLNTNPKEDTRTAREKYADNQRLARINAQFPKGQEYLKDFRNREKDKDLVPEARAGLESARNIAAQFNKSFKTLQTLAKSGNLEEAAVLAASIKQMGVKAREEIKLITKSLGESSNIGSTRLGSQLGQTLGQISSVQKKTDRIISVNKLSLPNIDTVGVGENTIDGIRQGVEKELDKLKATAEKIPNTVTDVVTEKLKIQSPSKIMMGYGENTGDGYGIGVERSLNRVKEIVKSGIDDIQKSFDFVSQDPLNPGEELTNNLHDWYLSHRRSFDPSRLNDILNNGLGIPRPDSVRAARELAMQAAGKLELEALQTFGV